MLQTLDCQCLLQSQCGYGTSFNVHAHHLTSMHSTRGKIWPYMLWAIDHIIWLLQGQCRCGTSIGNLAQHRRHKWPYVLWALDHITGVAAGSVRLWHINRCSCTAEETRVGYWGQRGAHRLQHSKQLPGNGWARAWAQQRATQQPEAAAVGLVQRPSVEALHRTRRPPG